MVVVVVVKYLDNNVFVLLIFAIILTILSSHTLNVIYTGLVCSAS